MSTEDKYKIDLDYLKSKLEKISFTPFKWEGEDKNLFAFNSKELFINWYCQPPSKVKEPWRDCGFYCRELAHVSRIIQPKTIVEFGTSLGIGTCLLHWLNPEAKLITVDINTETFMPGDIRVPIGYLAKQQNIPCEYITSPSSKYKMSNKVDLCFIDGDHSYAGVKEDSTRAWLNRSSNQHWAIVWHDYNDRHPGVVKAVNELCDILGKTLQLREDSDTVWIAGNNENY